MEFRVLHVLEKTRSDRKNLFLAAVLLLAFNVNFVSVAQAETGKPPDLNAAERGKALYEKFCASCHGVRGEGEPPVPWGIRRPDYILAPALDDSQHAWHHSDGNLVKMILNGSSRTQRMPSWQNVLTEPQANDLVHYIKSLWSPRALVCQGPKHMSCTKK